MYCNFTKFGELNEINWEKNTETAVHLVEIEQVAWEQAQEKSFGNSVKKISKQIKITWFPLM